MKTNIFLLLLLFTLILQSCNDKTIQYSGQVYKLKAGYGYKIFINETLAINQDCIPALKENRPFNDSLAASTIMSLVLEKMKQNKNPTITIADLSTYKIK